MYNSIKLDKLRGKRRAYKAIDSGCTKMLYSFTAAEQTLVLKLGAPVIFTATIDGAPNGTRGAVISMDNVVICVKLDNGMMINVKTFKFIVSSPTQQATRVQFRLRLAWSMTIHRAQGQTLSKVHVDCEGLFLPSMLPVAMSRVRSTEHLTISNLDYNDINFLPDIVRRWQQGDDVTSDSDSMLLGRDILMVGLLSNTTAKK